MGLTVNINHEFKTWLAGFIKDEIGVTQVQVATEAGMHRIWLNQLLTSKRSKRARWEMINHLEGALLRLAETTDKGKELKQEIKGKFAELPGLRYPQPDWDTADSSQYAAQIFREFLDDGVPEEHWDTVVQFIGSNVRCHKEWKK